MDSREGKRMLGLDEDCFVTGYVGSVERWYALEEVLKTLLEILKYRENAKLLIVGGSLFTDYEIYLKKLASQLAMEDKVIFTGLVEYKNLPKYISAMDVCLIPLSPPAWVNIAMPNKFFEYSACGKPILSTPIPDIIKIGGENLFIYWSKKEFVDRIKYIMNNPKKYEMDVNEYSWKRKAKELETLLQELIEGK